MNRFAIRLISVLLAGAFSLIGSAAPDRPRQLYSLMRVSLRPEARNLSVDMDVTKPIKLTQMRSLHPTSGGIPPLQEGR
jgi:hypothetical protein